MFIEKNTKELSLIYQKDYLCSEMIDDIKSFINIDLDKLEDDLENHYEKSINDNYIHIKEYFKYILEYITNNKIKNNKYKEFNNITLEQEKIIINFFILLYTYLIKNISFNKFKLFTLLLCHNIKYNNFAKINRIGCFSLCELNDQGVDVNQFTTVGNFQIDFINQITRGYYKTHPELIQIINNIAVSIDNAFNTEDMIVLEIDEVQLLIFERDENNPNRIIIHINDNSYTTLAIVDNENNFIQGDMENILYYFIKDDNIMNEIGTDLDKFINACQDNEEVEEEITSDEILKQLYVQMINNQES